MGADRRIHCRHRIPYQNTIRRQGMPCTGCGNRAERRPDSAESALGGADSDHGLSSLNDGGASAGAEPQALVGVPLSTKLSLPPLAIERNEIQF